MPTKTGRTTVKDVARESGVSIATVSYVLNDTPGQPIRPETRQRVLAAASALRYVPNAQAKNLRTGSSRIVAIDLSGHPGGLLLSVMAEQMAHEIRERGMLPVMHQPSREAPADRADLIELVKGVQPDWVVSLTPVESDVRRVLERLGVTRFTSFFSSDRVPFEIVRKAAMVQVRHLHEAGHQMIAYAGTSRPELEAFNASRQAGFDTACAQFEVSGWHLSPSVGVEERVTALAHLMDSSPGVSAVAAYSDEVAFELLAAAAALRVPVPSRLAIIGVDDIDLAAAAQPALTTVRVVDNLSPDYKLLHDDNAVGFSVESLDLEVVRRASA